MELTCHHVHWVGRVSWPLQSPRVARGRGQTEPGTPWCGSGTGEADDPGSLAIALAAVMGASLTSTIGAGPAFAADPALVSAASGRCLDVTGNVSTAGTAVDIWDCNNQSNQGWVLTSAGELRTFGSTMCLDVDHSGTTAGTAVLIWTCNGQTNQKWSWGTNGSLVGQQSGLCLDVNGGATANGTKAIIWTCNGQSNQRWTQSGTTSPGSTLVIDAATTVRPVTRVGSNFLYGLSDSTTPAVSLVSPLKPTWFRQPPPGSQHRPNGVPNPVGDTIKVASTVQAVNGKILVDMADSFDGFPYNWTSWTDWNSRIDYMFSTLARAPRGHERRGLGAVERTQLDVAHRRWELDGRLGPHGPARQAELAERDHPRPQRISSGTSPGCGPS